jgi:5'-nucleotidase / UDP-sugar diphosphatase
MMKRLLVLSLSFLSLASFARGQWACAEGSLVGAEGSLVGAAYRLTIIHVNDTHSKVEPSLTKLSFDVDDSLKARSVYLELGGYPYAAQVIGELRARETNPIVVHAGDFFQGTLYYTKYSGEADVAFWNLVKPDVATLGNHEFDKGSRALRDAFLSKVEFPIVDANVDMREDPILKDVAPEGYKIITIGKERIGVVGETTTETPYISSPGKSIAFLDPVISAQKAVDALTKAGVDKIVLLSHLGYDEDLVLAAKVSGIDVIVGGHSHTLLGEKFKADGLSPMGDYPVAVKDASGGTTLVVQSWEWAKVVGDLVVDFDAEGRVIGYEDKSELVAGSSLIQALDLPDRAGKLTRVRWQWNGYGLATSIYDGNAWVEAPKDSVAYWSKLYEKVRSAIASHPEIRLVVGDPEAWALVRGYALGVQDLQRTVIAQVGEDLKRSFNAGPGPIVADAMRAYTGVQIGMTNVGGVRIDLLAGPLTTAKVYEVIPFGNTLVTFKAKGAEIVKIFEDGIDFGLAKYGNIPSNPLLYVSGVRLSVAPASPKGSRVRDVKVQRADESWTDLDPDATYTMVVNNFMAAGGDKYDTVKSIAGKIDSGYIDAEAFFAFVKGKTLVNPEERIKLLK